MKNGKKRTEFSPFFGKNTRGTGRIACPSSCKYHFFFFSRCSIFLPAHLASYTQAVVVAASRTVPMASCFFIFMANS